MTASRTPNRQAGVWDAWSEQSKGCKGSAAASAASAASAEGEVVTWLFVGDLPLGMI